MPIGYVGGVSVLSNSDFKKINGFSNVFWGWGGEDDDLYHRLLFHNLTLTRPFDGQPSFIISQARYSMLDHNEAKPNPERMELISQGKQRLQFDGLNNVRYKVLNLEMKPLYTHFLVDIQQQNFINVNSITS